MGASVPGDPQPVRGRGHLSPKERESRHGVRMLVASVAETGDVRGRGFAATASCGLLECRVHLSWRGLRGLRTRPSRSAATRQPEVSYGGGQGLGCYGWPGRGRHVGCPRRRRSDRPASPRSARRRTGAGAAKPDRTLLLSVRGPPAGAVPHTPAAFGGEKLYWLVQRWCSCELRCVPPVTLARRSDGGTRRCLTR